MSIQTEIDRIAANVTAALAACADKGASVPSGSTSDDLAAIIAAIEAGGGGVSVAVGQFTLSEVQDNYTIEHNLGGIPDFGVCLNNPTYGAVTATRRTMWFYRKKTGTTTSWYQYNFYINSGVYGGSCMTDPTTTEEAIAAYTHSSLKMPVAWFDATESTIKVGCISGLAYYGLSNKGEYTWLLARGAGAIG